MKGTRLDVLLVERGFAPSRTRAQRLIREGFVRVGGRVVHRPSAPVPPGAPVDVDGTDCPFVSRGGLKLAAALDAFAIEVAGRAALDVGASTGGFTDCLLQRGARHVVALDVGHGQLHPSLRADARVSSFEGVHILDAADHAAVRAALASHRPTLAVADVSFISLRRVLPGIGALVERPADVVALVKPQFELGPGAVNRRGVVRDEGARRRAVRAVVEACEALGWAVRGTCPSPIEGAAGNAEYLLAARIEG